MTEPVSYLLLTVNSWIGFFFCYLVIMLIYYSNLWNVSFLLLLSIHVRDN